MAKLNNRGPRSKPASDSYQYRIVEVGVTAQNLHNFSLQDGIGAQLELNAIDPRIIDLQGELIKEMYVLIDECLTPHQNTVMKLYLQGFTQGEIAGQLNCTQSAVHKCLHGNLDYKNIDEAGEPSRYGGSVKKLEKFANRSIRVQEILRKIDDVKKENDDE